MAYLPYNNYIEDTGGTFISNVFITAYISGTNNLATIYYDVDGLNVVPNSVVVSDSNGFFYFYVASGTIIDLYIKKTGFIAPQWVRNITPPFTVKGSPRTMTSSGNILSSDYVVSFDRTGGNITATLPDQSTVNKGQPLYLKVLADGQGNSYTVTVVTPDGSLIDNASSLELTLENEKSVLIPDGIKWESY